MLSRRRLVGLAAATALARPALAQGPDSITFGTNWLAQAEHGGFYQAVADGTYRRLGLDVRIVQGGPQSNNRILLPVGRIDFYMGGNMIQALAAVAGDIPTLVVAAMFQKDPQVLLSHPGQGLDRFADLPRADTLLISREGRASFFPWLRAEHGFLDERVRPYTFNTAPFLADKRSVMQGYLTSEPVAIEREAGFRPNVFLLADHGFDTYSTTIETRTEMVERRPDIVRRFVEGSILGWRSYLAGDNGAANALIRRDNPAMGEDRIAAAVELLRRHRIVEGDVGEAGIGTMTDARHESFFRKMARAGLFASDLDHRRAYTLAFVNRLPRG